VQQLTAAPTAAEAATGCGPGCYCSSTAVDAAAAAVARMAAACKECNASKAYSTIVGLLSLAFSPAFALLSFLQQQQQRRDYVSSCSYCTLCHVLACMSDQMLAAYPEGWAIDQSFSGKCFYCQL
jgi:hypothetical protein